MPGQRHHPDAFKREVCHQIRSGLIGRREAQRRYALSDNLLQIWLARYDGARPRPKASTHFDRSLHAACERRIALLERKVGQLTLALEAATNAHSD